MVSKYLNFGWLFLLLISLGEAAERCSESCEELSKYTFIKNTATKDFEKLPNCDYSHCFQDCGRNLNTHTSYEEVLQFIDDVINTCPQISRYYSIGKSEDGRDLSVLEISDNPGTHEALEPEFKYVANMHGNEVVGKELLINLVHCMCVNYGRDELLTHTVDNVRMHFLFSLNPDGYAMANDDDWLRGRENANSVDINRDFPDLDSVAFSLEKRKVCKSDHLSKYMSGFTEDVAGRQSETRAIVEWLKKVPFVLSANLHGGSFVANYPFDTNTEGVRADTKTPDNNVFEQLARTYAESHTFMSNGDLIPCPGDKERFEDGITIGARWYPVSGGMQDFNYLFSNSFEITLELGCVKFPKRKDMWMYHWQNKKALVNYIRQSLTGMKGLVVDEVSREPIANATIIVFNDKTEEHEECHAITTTAYGDFFRLLQKGTYEVLITKPGYKDFETTVEVPKGHARSVEPILMKRV